MAGSAAPESPRSANLDPAAAQALKQFVKKNRPPQPQATTPVFLSEPAYDTAGDGEDAVQKVPTVIDPNSLSPDIRKFDIFDTIDEDRVKEFESHFQEARVESNYDEFKSNFNKKDAKKFMTSTGVTVKEDGIRVLT
uniref:Uncharacterized protein n=1 Tax=Alexandrium monilatum TaxID=311494 RepID=A0A6T0ZSN9_9DINO|mmetsp:Transcript_95874/g.286173  ORF Transcript_95874/g.286173 Transcript_95874/m.286173 type:complete len:137 (-) Transcript_95874:143-553(-)